MLLQIQDTERQAPPIIVSMNGEDRFSSQPVQALFIEGPDAIKGLCDDEGNITLNPPSLFFTEISVH